MRVCVYTGYMCTFVYMCEDPSCVECKCVRCACCGCVTSVSVCVRACVRVKICEYECSVVMPSPRMTETEQYEKGGSNGGGED